MRKIVQIIAFPILIIIGIIIGLVIGNIPYITMKSTVGFGEIATFMLALVVAFILPISLNYWLDNKKNIKGFLIDESKSCIQSLESLKNKIDQCNIEKKTEGKDKREIMSLLKFISLKVSSLTKQLELSFDKKSAKMRENLTRKERIYWKKVTGGDLMNKDFKIDYTFCAQHDQALLIFVIFLRESIYKINDF